MSAIRLDKVSVCYGDDTIVHDVDLNIAQGELHVLLGESGSGKTTLLRAIAGFEPILTGSITVADVIVAGPNWVPPEHRNVGVVFQDYALFSHLDVAGNVGFANRSTAATVAKHLSQVNLGGYENRSVATLSGGEQQRIALARALAQDPQVILLDEPFSNLNPSLRGKLRLATINTLRSAGITGVFVTHDRQEAFEIADRISAIRDGRLLQTGKPQTLYDTPNCLSVARSLGETIELPCRSDGEVAECILGKIAIRNTHNSASTLMIRPEQILLEPTGSLATVRRVRYFGAAHKIDLSIGKEMISMSVCAPKLHVGDTVGISVDGTCIALNE